MGQCMESMGAAQAAAYTIYEIIDRVPTIDSESNAGMSFENGDIRFSSVDFTFPAREEQQVLKGVTFEVRQGETVALCGQSGCGKSTCIKLLQRFYDVCSGSITIAGSNIKVSTWDSENSIVELREDVFTCGRSFFFEPSAFFEQSFNLGYECPITSRKYRYCLPRTDPF